MLFYFLVCSVTATNDKNNFFNHNLSTKFDCKNTTFF